MILIKASQVSYSNEIVDLTKVFFPGEEVANQEKHPDQSTGDILLECDYTALDQGSFSFYAHLSSNSVPIQESRLQRSIVSTDEHDIYRSIKNGLKGCAYNLLSSYTGKQPKWGILTGIRPTKIVNKMMDEGLSDEVIRAELHNIYKLHDSKSNLLIKTAKLQRPYIQDRESKTVCIYIHIPFCATKCLYCSFPSDLIERVTDKMEKYLDCLELELSSTMKLFKEKGILVDTIYIGGGTPTVLNYSDLRRMLGIVKATVGTDQGILEYTVEAGRPDSLDENKLLLLKEFGVTRLSINPQTMNQKTLDLIGRSHSVEDIINIYRKARSIGFDSINMDVIIGLPGETVEDLKHTMEEIAALKPDNITVHTLALKRASRLKESFQQYDPSREGLAEEMAAICKTSVEGLQMSPYYLYRQKYMLDHLENIGYAVPGKECIYNIHIMEEKRSIWAFGAGAMSKCYYPAEDRLERIVNVKNLDEYINRIEEMIEKKQKVILAQK